jgi:hypothetical protein
MHSLHLDEEGYRRFCGTGVLHTDDNPVLEFSSPLSFHQYNQTFRQNLAETLRYRPTDLRPFLVGLPESRAADWDAQARAAVNFCQVLVCFYDVLMAQGRGDMDEVLRVLGKAIGLAEAGLATHPQDRSRERFYTAFFEQAQLWLQTTAGQE